MSKIALKFPKCGRRRLWGLWFFFFFFFFMTNCFIHQVDILIYFRVSGCLWTINNYLFGSPIICCIYLRRAKHCTSLKRILKPPSVLLLPPLDCYLTFSPSNRDDSACFSTLSFPFTSDNSCFSRISAPPACSWEQDVRRCFSRTLLDDIRLFSALVPPCRNFKPAESTDVIGWSAAVYDETN